MCMFWLLLIASFRVICGLQAITPFGVLKAQYMHAASRVDSPRSSQLRVVFGPWGLVEAATSERVQIRDRLPRRARPTST